jgi:hypothetical protein
MVDQRQGTALRVLPKSSTCTDVVDKGNGVYYKMDGSVHTHTLQSFRDGDKR